MGGMIAQALAIAHPEQVESLCSIMSTTGDTEVGTPTPEALAALLAPAPTDRDGYIERQVAIQAAIGSPGFPTDVERTKQRAGRAFDRSFRPDGVVRQVLAIVSSPDRTEALGHLSIPTLVIHGEDDPLVALSGGKATAAAIPGLATNHDPGHGSRPAEGDLAPGRLRDIPQRRSRSVGMSGPLSGIKIVELAGRARALRMHAARRRRGRHHPGRKNSC